MAATVADGARHQLACDCVRPDALLGPVLFRQAHATNSRASSLRRLLLLSMQPVPSPKARHCLLVLWVGLHWVPRFLTSTATTGCKHFATFLVHCRVFCFFNEETRR